MRCDASALLGQACCLGLAHVVYLPVPVPRSGLGVRDTPLKLGADWH